MESVPNNPPANQVVASEHPQDKVGDTKTLYQVSAWTIISRNFLAGFARTLGSLVIYSIFIGVTLIIFLQTVYPKILPLFEQYQQALSSLSNAGQTSNSTIQTLPITNEQFQKIQELLPQPSPKI